MKKIREGKNDELAAFLWFPLSDEEAESRHLIQSRILAARTAILSYCPGVRHREVALSYLELAFWAAERSLMQKSRWREEGNRGD